MTDINPIGQTPPTGSTSSARPSYVATPASKQARGEDQVQFSRAARLLSQIHDLPDVRHDLVSKVKAEIESGRYETPEKLDKAVDNLVEDLV